MKYFLIAAVAATTMFAVNAPASAATVSCTIPNSVSCKVTSTKGFKRVWVQSTQGFGILADKHYNTCPKTVTIGWDSAYHGDVKYRECKFAGLAPVGAGVKPGLQGGNFRVSQ